jgi:ketosteroid isomerase-like protein
MEDMKWLGRIVLVALLVIVLWQAGQRLFVSEETRIRRAIAKMEQAIEDNQIVALADLIAGNYHDEHGLDKASLLAAVRSVRMQYAALLIHITDINIERAPDGSTSQATLIAKILTKRADGGQTEINAERVRLFLRQTDDGWKLTRIESPELKFD